MGAGSWLIWLPHVLLCWLLLREWQDGRREDRLWAERQARLHGLNRPRSRPVGILAYKVAIERQLFWGDLDAFEYRPGAIWPVDDPAQVALLARGLHGSGLAAMQGGR